MESFHPEVYLGALGFAEFLLYLVIHEYEQKP